MKAMTKEERQDRKAMKRIKKLASIILKNPKIPSKERVAEFKVQLKELSKIMVIEGNERELTEDDINRLTPEECLELQQELAGYLNGIVDKYEKGQIIEVAENENR